MGAISIYAIKSAICLALMYIPYMLMLRRETFFRFNRGVLVAILFLSLALPLLNIAPWAFLDQTEIGAMNRAITEVGVPMIEIGAPTMELVDEYATSGQLASTSTVSVGWADALVAVYILGALVVFVVKLVQLLKMLRFMRRGVLWTNREDGVTVYCHARDVVPFSWANRIVISERDYNESGREILLHEKAHVRCGHSADVCMVALCEVLQWFNPFVWLLSSSLSDVHEYEADAEVLRAGVNAHSYQMLLIKKAVGSSSYAFANSFNHSLLKKRITMMMKKKSSPWMRTKALYVIPVAGIALSAFATSEFTNSVELISESKVSNLTSNVQMPEQVAQPEVVQQTLPAVDADSVDSKPKKVNPIVVVDGEVTDYRFDRVLNGRSEANEEDFAKLLELKPEDIEAVTVLKGTPAVALYGEKGKDGAILIETIATKKVADKSVADTVKVAEEAGESGIFIECEQMPQFPGGHGELMKFIASNIRYPKLAVEYGVKGRVLVQFVVNKDGSVGEHSILSSKITRPINRTDSMRVAAEQGAMLDEVMVTALQMTDSGDPNILSVAALKDLVKRMPGAEMDEVGNVTINGKAVKTLKVEGKEYKIDQNMVAYQNARIALEEEAVRVLKLMPKWTPGMQRGKAVRVRYTMPVIYRLQ